MRYVVYVFILFLFMAGVAPSQTFAVSPNNCNDFGAVAPDQFANRVLEVFAQSSSTTPSRELVFFTDKDLQTTVTHLQQYCCNEGSVLASSTCESVPAGSYYPYSKFLGDHLLDIGFRKLDGVEEHCNEIVGASCDNRQIVPNKATERREKITEIAEDREGYPPVLLAELFQEYRGDAETITQGLKDIPADNRSSIDTLYPQYMLLCDEINQIYARISGPLGPSTANISSRVGKNLYDTCLHMAKQRYHQEWQYVRTLMVEKGIDYYTQNLESYLLDYLIENRFDALVDKYLGLEGCFSSVLSYTANTACCNE